jgi:hypothetical protein
VTPAGFRRLALALPDTVEGEHHGHPDFRAHGRVIASLHPDGERAMVRVPVPLQQQLVAAHVNAFEPANGAWGRAGCTMLRLAHAEPAVVRDALTEAWQFAAASGATKATKVTKVTKTRRAPGKTARSTKATRRR